MMPDFYVFYCRHRTGDIISSYAPEPMSLARIVDLAVDVLENTGDFLGLVDEDEGLLQVMYLARGAEDERPIRLEIRDMARHGVTPNKFPGANWPMSCATCQNGFQWTPFPAFTSKAAWGEGGRPSIRSRSSQKIGSFSQESWPHTATS